MSLTVAAAFARRGRPSKTLPPVALTSLGAATAAVPYHHHQQTRSYRFGRLSSYLEPYFHPEAYTRHRSSGYKYCEHLYQRRSGSKHTLTEDAKSALKRVVNNYWCPNHSGRQGAGRYLNTHASPRRTPDNPEGIRPGQNIEDAERAPLEHLLFGGKLRPRANRNDNRSATTKDRAASASQGNPEADFVIDPITNRKMPRQPLESTYSTTDQGVEPPARPFESYRSQFEPFRAPQLEDAQSPIFHDGPPPEAELRMYDELWGSVTQSDARPIINHYGTPRSTLLDALKSEHKEVRWHASDAIASGSVKTTPEPSTESPDAPEYSDLDQYTAVRYHEPDGKLPEEEPVSKREELAKYNAFRAHEPNGKYKLEHETPANPEEVNSYGAVWSHEPDGKYAAEYTEGPDAAELAAYGKPFLSHEPDGRYAANHVEAGYDSAELAKYRQPFFAHEPDGMYAASYAEPRPHEAELSQYKAFRSHEPDGMYATNHVEEKPDSAELSTYGAFRSHEPDGKYAANHVEAKPDSAELSTYGAFRSHEPDGKYALRNATPAEPADAQRYQAFRSHEPDGKYAAEAEASKETAKEAEDLANHEAFGYEDAETRPLPQEVQPAYEDYDPAELRKYEAVRWNEPDGQPTQQLPAQDQTPFRKKVEQLMAQAAAESDLSDNTPSDPQQPSGGSRPLTGNYIRDFPEDFSKSWTATTSTAQSNSPLLSPEQQQQQQSPARVQPSLDRYGNPSPPTPVPRSKQQQARSTKY